MGYAFISYSSKNQSAADAMKKLLDKNSIASWMAPGDIPPASTYATEINKAIKNCSCMVLMLTNDAQNSVWVAKEVERAVHYHKPVLPIQLEDVVLNDEFEFYISTNQIVAVNRMDESSPELQRALASIRTYTSSVSSTDSYSAPRSAYPGAASSQPNFSTQKTTSYPHLAEKQALAQKMGKKLAAGLSHVIGLKNNGTVLAAGQTKDRLRWSAGPFWDKYEGQCEVYHWQNITAVAAGHSHTVGLRSDGTVVAAGNSSSTKCHVSDWKDIVAIAAGAHFTAGLKKDGTVVIAGADFYNSTTLTYQTIDVSSWRNITAIAAGGDHLVGIQRDGTVIAAGKADEGQCDTAGWSEIVAITANDNVTVGLRANGTLVTTINQRLHHLYKRATEWTDVVAVVAAHGVVALRANGTTVSTFASDDTYSNVIALSAGTVDTLFLKEDGSVIYEGSEKSIENKTKHWNLFK